MKINGTGWTRAALQSAVIRPSRHWLDTTIGQDHT